ncbi:MAG TPA: prephenate/arogenate dehydrogenase family protein [Alphaproteobacteria bacterium]|nr:prephenate/arogenate dehydrogenase family protein [Alphaproteobacteria bacterium]
MSDPLFDKLCIIGIGLIGSSIARGARRHNLAKTIAIADASAEALREAEALKLGDSYHADPAAAARDADLVIICVPIGAYPAVGQAIAPALKPGAILSDVGSVKQAAVRDLGPLVPDHAHFIPGHPVAGTEHSGPKAGFAELFEGRWQILTPLPGTDEGAVERLARFWRGLGSNVEIMEPVHHDQVLAITSHLPHLIAYTIVGTATGLEDSTQREVIKFSASGFRDFTRIAASNPIMWRDIFLNNREAVLEMLGRFSEDLTALQRAIRWGEGEKLEDWFTRTRAVRRSIIDAKQA